MCPASKALKMTTALAGALKREQRQNHAENITCYCPEATKPPAGRRGRARGCRGRSGAALGCVQRSEKERWRPVQSRERAAAPGFLREPRRGYQTEVAEGALRSAGSERQELVSE